MRTDRSAAKDGCGASRRFEAFGAALAGCVLLAPLAASAQADAGGSERVVYEAGFFDAYNPVTALDMVERTPGFEIDEGAELRGFGATAGNVLINGERPSTKTDSLADILKRIPASRVARIEIIRGATAASEARAQSVLLNIVLKSGKERAGSSVAWEGALIRNGGRAAPRGEASLTGSVGKTDFTLGVERYQIYWRDKGPEAFVSADGEDQTRDEREDGDFSFTSGAATTETRFDNGDILRTSSQVHRESEDAAEASLRFPASGGPPDLFAQDFGRDSLSIEIATDYKRALTDNLSAKAILLAHFVDSEFADELEIARADGSASASRFSAASEEGESVARLEFDWTGSARHKLQFGGEAVYNFIDSEATLIVDGAEIPIDGADTRVSEIRGEVFIADSWTVNEKLTVDGGFALERSTIRQTGDVENERSFVYPKPSLALTYDFADGLQLRLRAERKAAQLDFDEFVSAANFDDEDVDFGNPELRPERTWASEAAIEKRFGEIGVVTVRGFYDRIDDVQDLLPLGGVFETPGNIGDGRRWGGEIKTAVPLGRAEGLKTRLETSAYVQDSRVVDPVTGFPRTLSNERPWRYSIRFRQDAPAARLSWGWSVSDSAPEKFFGLDELVVVDEGVDLEAFIETTRIPGVKARLGVGNILNRDETRERIVFDGRRGLSPVAFSETRARDGGLSVSLTLSGTF